MGFDVPMDKNATNLKQQVISKINSLTEDELEKLLNMIEAVFPEKN